MTSIMLSIRLLCEMQESPSPVGHLSSLEALDTPLSLPDKRTNPTSPVTLSQQPLQSTPLSHLQHNVLPATDLSTTINAAHLRQDQTVTEKQPPSLIDSQQGKQPGPFAPVSIIKNRTPVIS